MMEVQYMLPAGSRPEWLNYPYAFRRIVRQALYNLEPWHILEANQASARLQGLMERYSSRELFPFACRQDNDDLACWAKGMGENVFVIHDFASPGWEDEAAFADVWSWFRAAVEETIAWD